MKSSLSPMKIARPLGLLLSLSLLLTACGKDERPQVQPENQPLEKVVPSAELDKVGTNGDFGTTYSVFVTLPDPVDPFKGANFIMSIDASEKGSLDSNQTKISADKKTNLVKGLAVDSSLKVLIVKHTVDTNVNEKTGEWGGGIAYVFSRSDIAQDKFEFLRSVEYGSEKELLSLKSNLNKATGCWEKDIAKVAKLWSKGEVLIGSPTGDSGCPVSDASVEASDETKASTKDIKAESVLTEVHGF